MNKKISLADWAKIVGTLGGGIVTFIGFVVWLTHVDTRVQAVSEAQAQMRTDISSDRSVVARQGEELLGELRDINTRLSRIEGMQKSVLNEVKSGN